VSLTIMKETMIFNIWFTMAVAPDSLFGFKKTIELLAKLTDADDYIVLPTLKLFKINVKT